MTEESLFLRIKDGDDEAVKVLYEKYRGEFIQWAIKRHQSNEEEAKDVFQNIIVIFFSKVNSGKLAVLESSIKTYLFGIGKNLLKQRIEDLSLDEILISELVDAEKEDNEKLNILMSEMEKMSDLCTSILKHYYFNGYSMEDIAIEFDYKSIDSAKTQRYKCLQKLKNAIKLNQNGK